jgi:hypothetical protein
MSFFIYLIVADDYLGRVHVPEMGRMGNELEGARWLLWCPSRGSVGGDGLR